MTCDIIIPWSGNCVYRASARSYVESCWHRAGFDVVVGQISGPWSKGHAVATALTKSTADVLVVTDADVWTDAVFEAIEVVERGARGWAAPFLTINRLTLEASTAVMAGGPWGGRLAKPAYRAVPGGGLVVIRRDLYEEVPLDPRFVGWGHEDEAWGMALRVIAGPAYQPKVPVPLWHLWHPAQDKSANPDRRFNQHLRGKYAQARRSRPLMEALVSEARQALGW